RADGAHVDHVHLVLVRQRLALGHDDRVAVAAVRDVELVLARDLVAEADAARAQDAAFAVERDLVGPRDVLLLVNLLEFEARAVVADAEAVLLQLALARLVADRAVERVVDEQELHHVFLPALGLLARGLDDHVVRALRVARDLERTLALDLDEADAAVAGDGQSRRPAVVRHLDAHLPRGLDDRRALGDVDLLAVDLELGHGYAFPFRRPAAISGLL